MTNLDIEEETIQQKLFNKEVIKLLFEYVLRYKHYLFYAFCFVLLTTATTLLVPLISSIVVDKYIVKTGYIAEINTATDGLEEFTATVKKKGELLGDNRWFIYQNTLKHFSKQQINQLIKKGLLSEEKYTPFQIRTFSSALNNKVTRLIDNGTLKKIGSTVLLNDRSSAEFTNAEMLELRYDDLKKVLLFSALMLGLFSVQFIASYLQILALMKLSQKAMRDLRTDLFSHIVSLELSFFDKNPVGKLVNRVTNDIETLNEMFSSVIVNMSQNLLVMTGVIVMMFMTDAYLASLVCVTIPFLFLVIVIFRAQARSAYRIIRTKIADLNTFLNENISGIRVTQIFVQEKKQFEKFKKINKEVYSANIRQLNIYAIFRPLIDFFRWFAIGTIIYFGAQALVEDKISYGVIIMFLAYIGTFFEPIGELAEKIDILQSATASGEKILSIFKTSAHKEIHSTLSSNQRRTIPQKLKGKIVFDDVWFSYVPGEWVLKGVSFSVEPESTLAVVGETGSGKSTIISLLSRFYTVQKGRILIDGYDINEIPYQVLRKNISTVMQDVFLFSRTIKSNIILNEHFDKERFDKIVHCTNAHYFIEKLAQKEDEMVMERGVTLSAGERQLLAFARSLYAQPSILILDEATSNIDTYTEQLIQAAIAELTRNRTTIAIAHRLSTVRNADQIIVIDKGAIVENGTHDSLIASNGLYYDLYRLQFENA